MFRSIGLLVLCCLFVVVFSDDEATDCIFDWKYFSNEGKGSHIVVDYSGQHITTLEDGDKTYHYISGPVNTRSDVGNDYQVYYSVSPLGGDGQPIDGVIPACDFLEKIYPDYFLPIGGMHNNFPSQESICPMKRGTTEIFETEDSDQLKAPSKLANGRYWMEVSFLYKSESVGGISGSFTVLRD